MISTLDCLLWIDKAAKKIRRLPPVRVARLPGQEVDQREQVQAAAYLPPAGRQLATGRLESVAEALDEAGRVPVLEAQHVADVEQRRAAERELPVQHRHRPGVADQQVLR